MLNKIGKGERDCFNLNAFLARLFKDFIGSG
jgi:hypothetical protein